MGSRTGLRCVSEVILWLGELKPSTTTITVDLDTSGQTRSFCNVLEQLSHDSFQFLLGDQCSSLGSRIGSQRQRGKGERLTSDPNEL